MKTCPIKPVAKLFTAVQLSLTKASRQGLMRSRL